jgi:glycosyltransferase involved in cell wall biosynthesis
VTPVALVAGDFVSTGGMDVANLALADYLARRRPEVHVVAHRAAPELVARPSVRFHRVGKPAGSYLLGAPLLERAGRRWIERVRARGGAGVVNGGNCAAGDLNWLHYVHAAHHPQAAGGPFRRALRGWSHARFRAEEREAVARARVVVANSERTRQDAIERLGADPARVHTVYYGVDPERFRPPTAAERTGARRALGWEPDQPVVLFVGALGDRRKGFDTLFAAWERVCGEPGWDARLAVVGAGSELPEWRARAARVAAGRSISFLGFRRDVRTVVWAADVVAAPSRYEAFGLAVAEALCCGLPAVVSAGAGVAERVAGPLRELLVGDPASADEVAERLLAWRRGAPRYAALAAVLGGELRGRGWDAMAAEIDALLRTLA